MEEDHFRPRIRKDLCASRHSLAMYNGAGCYLVAASPKMYAMSAINGAPTSSAISWNCAKWMTRGEAEAPHQHRGAEPHSPSAKFIEVGRTRLGVHFLRQRLVVAMSEMAITQVKSHGPCMWREHCCVYRDVVGLP